MTIDLDALEKLADEATPGEWTTYVSGAPEYNNVAHGIEIGEEGPLVVGAFEHEQDCAYVHAVQPATIKALISELKEARGLLVQSLNGLALETVDGFALRNRLQAFLARNGKGERK